MLESCLHCGARVLYTSDYCPSCHRSRTDGGMEAGFVAALPSASLARSMSRKRRLLPFWLGVLLTGLGYVFSGLPEPQLACFLLAAGLSAGGVFVLQRGYRIAASLLVIVALVSAYMAYRHSVKYLGVALYPPWGSPMTEAPNKRAGGHDGIPVLFHAGRSWAAAPHHVPWLGNKTPLQ